jgi:dihydroxyacetone kinase
MLSACVSGEIFASPSSKQILHTIRVAASPSEAPSKKCDVLVIINNYTGDRLNFGLAIEKAKVLYPDVNIASVVVSDDVSLLDSPTTQAVGPRGLAGNILVCKLLGALAQTGADLETVKLYGDVVVSDLSSIGVTLEHCHVPGRAPNAELMPDGECEVGLGLHNEAGVSRRKMDGVQGVIQEMIEMIVNSKTESSSIIGREDDLVLFVNNLGGVSQLEMGAILSDVVDELGSS